MAYAIIQIEVNEPRVDLRVPEDFNGVALIVRARRRPAAFIMKELKGGSVLTAETLDRILKTEIRPHLLDGARIESERSQNAIDSPSLTVAICTKDHPDNLRRCLMSLLGLRTAAAGDDFEILVVDNAPSDRRTQELVDLIPGVRYAREPKPGLNFARNRALQEATGELIAFIDDDVTVDPIWLDGLRRVLREHPDAGAITGLVLPAELATEAQILFERRGGFEKKFETTRYGASLPGHLFYPCVGGMFGTGCNMAFNRKAALTIGGFDEALDTGAPLPGGGDTDMLYRTIRAGHPIIYEPRFLVYHRHRREMSGLRRQYSRSWGRGLMAFVAKTYASDPDQRPNLRRLVAWWFTNESKQLLLSLAGRHLLSPEMLIAEIWGGVVGLLGAYSRSVKRAEQIRRDHSIPETSQTKSASTSVTRG